MNWLPDKVLRDYQELFGACRCPRCGDPADLTRLPQEAKSHASCTILHEFPLLARVLFNVRAGRIQWVTREGVPYSEDDLLAEWPS